jgi:murein DD-endopeptidase MepM/ murein hydrolase activator NlpD
LSTPRPHAPREGTTHARDLGSVEIWERSLAHSRQRRRLAELGRRARRKRKSVSLAVSAALATVPAVAAADSISGPGAAHGTSTVSDGVLTASGKRIVLQMGNRGELVAAAQLRLNDVLPLTHLAVDGIFGPTTRAAVLQFQRSHGLTASGAIDALTWAVMFKAPVLVMDGAPPAPSTAASSGNAEPTVIGSAASDGSPQSPAPSGEATAREAAVSQASSSMAADTEAAASPSAAGESGAAGSHAAGSAGSNATSGERSGTPQASGTPPGPSASATPSTAETKSAQPVAVVAPSTRSSQPSTYVLANGVALPLPRQYITNPYVDQGVDYSAPGGTPLYAMGEGVIIGEGISGFGPNAPILRITSGPLKGVEIYYGHAGADLVKVGQHVTAGQQIGVVGAGIVGISTGPHLEIGFYPPGPMGARWDAGA